MHQKNNTVISQTTISQATARNWKKLHTSEEGRLTKRANKRNSQKRIFPVEYFCKPENLDFVQKVLKKADENEWPVDSFIMSLGINILKKSKIFEMDHVQNCLQEYRDIATIDDLLQMDLPENENDLLGLFYQSLLQEGEKNIKGAYYTPCKVVKNMMKNFSFSHDRTFFDPCCGSGAFLLASEAENPDQLWGADNDPVAVMIAKMNLLLKYSNRKFRPQIYNLDFLQEDSCHFQSDLSGKYFDYIATNPPWGALIKSTDALIKSSFCPKEISSGETFSCFFVKSYRQLKKNGRICFLFPESVLNVKCHKDIRSFILNNCCLSDITIYRDMFSGVSTRYVDIECMKSEKKTTFSFHTDNRISQIEISSIYETDNRVISFLNEMDLSIVRRAKSKGRYSLRKSIWALGVVTGDNKNRLSDTKKMGMEKIFTGREIGRYVLKPARKFIIYKRENLQQVAREEIYRSPAKLVYKFISNKLVFAYDDSKSLFLNSANILIPDIPNMTIKTVMAFLNSDLFQFLYIKMFGEHKILRGNLEELPFPDISQEENLKIDQLVEELIKGDSSKESEIQNLIMKIYNYNEKQISYIMKMMFRADRKPVME